VHGIFGAESALGKSGAAVDAFAVTDVRLLRYPASALPTALQESASLRRKMLGGIARNLHDATSDALDLLRDTEVIARLVQGDSDPDALIAASALMRKIERKIPECAEQNTPVLIAGEDGTGKTQIARLIHDASSRSSGQLIAVNCRDLNPGHAAELILGEDLGGSLTTGGHASGGIHLAHNGTLVLRGEDAAPPGVDVTDTPLVKTLLRRAGLPLLRAGALAGFAAVIVLCLAFSTTIAGRLANTAIWSLWEPVVFATRAPRTSLYSPSP